MKPDVEQNPLHVGHLFNRPGLCWKQGGLQSAVAVAASFPTCDISRIVPGAEFFLEAQPTACSSSPFNDFVNILLVYRMFAIEL